MRSIPNASKFANANPIWKLGEYYYPGREAEARALAPARFPRPRLPLFKNFCFFDLDPPFGPRISLLVVRSSRVRNRPKFLRFQEFFCSLCGRPRTSPSKRTQMMLHEGDWRMVCVYGKAAMPL